MKNHKQSIKSIVLLLVLTTIINVKAQYTLLDTDVTVVDGIITECLTDTSVWGTSEIIIPSILDDQTIIGIADKEHGHGVFEMKELTKVTLPLTIKKVGDWAFQYNSLKSITFPSSLDSIKSKAFSHNYFEEIIFEDNCNLVFIGDNAFSYNRSHLVIDNITFPKKLNYIENSAFLNNEINNIIFKKDGSLKYIGTCAFDRSRATNIVLPDSLVYIGDLAFIRHSLTDIQLPKMISHIGIYAFAEGGISSIDLPDPVIKKDSTFTEWQNSNGLKISQITDHTLSYNAKFISGRTSVVNNPTNSGTMQIYPNPAVHNLYINHNNITVVAEIFDIQGNLVCQNILNPEQNSIDIDALNKGIYFIKIIDAENTIIKRFIKE